MTLPAKLQIHLCCILLVFTYACKNKPDETESFTEPENVVDYSISNVDSGVQLQFSNFDLTKKDSFELRVNGQVPVYTLSKGSKMLIQAEQFKQGSNIIDFIFTLNKKRDTLQKNFFNVLRIKYEVLATYKHNSQYFTQGLLFDESGNLIESMGLNGKSRIVFYKTVGNGFRPLDSIINLQEEFGEGIAIVGGQLIQLLWQNEYIRIFDKASHNHIRNVGYNRQGWGICNDGNTLYTSDGSGSIHVVDISEKQARIIKTIPVHDDRRNINHINELEFINGLIFANIWQTAFIYVIDPSTGAVLGKMDLSPLLAGEEKMNPNIDVLNGIAFNAAKQTLLVTGKHWANFYELRLKTDLKAQTR